MLPSVLVLLSRPFLSARRTQTTLACRSMSRCSSAIHSPGRNPSRPQRRPAARSAAPAARRTRRVSPRLERSLLGAATLRIVDSLLSRVGVDHSQTTALRAPAAAPGSPRNGGRRRLSSARLRSLQAKLWKAAATEGEERLASSQESCRSSPAPRRVGRVLLNELLQGQAAADPVLPPELFERPFECFRRSRSEENLPAATVPSRTAGPPNRAAVDSTFLELED